MNADKFTQKTIETIQTAQSMAQENGNQYLTPEHLLYALVDADGGLIGTLLGRMGVDCNAVLSELDTAIDQLPKVSGGSGEVYASPEVGKILNLAEKTAEKLHDEYLSVEHLMLAIFSEGSQSVRQLLSDHGITRSRFSDELAKVKTSPVTSDNPEDSYDALKKYGTDLVERARTKELDPVIGRDAEIRNVIRILSRKTKNNPVLIGEPGVGKTAVVEGLAQKINAGDVPETLKDKQVYSLDLGSMVAGSRYRGDFEERLKKVLKEIKTRGDIVLFIDEIHTIVGAGSADGALGASDMLKPMLARGELQTIGATTTDEYRKYIEKDAALERRFQPIQVHEPTIAETIEILKGLRSRYENHHHVTITDGALQSAAELSSRYIQDRNLPDKAIDLIDEAGARLRIKRLTAPPELKELDQKVAKVAAEKDKAIKDQDFEKAAELRDNQEKLEAERKEKESSWREGESDVEMVVNEDVIAQVISSTTGIPVFKLTQAESKKLLGMESELHKRIIGQDEAVSALSRSIRRTRVGLKDPKRPAGSFIFAGPTGVGKTELAKALAEFLFDDEDALIRVDMSEFSEKYAASRLFGAPPGYVGYEEGGQLSEKVRRNPYSVILFDEIEKAHPDVFNILLQVLDDGHITDAQGRKVDFKQTCIIMTSNAGAQNIVAPKRLGFLSTEDERKDYEYMKGQVMEEVKRMFKPEFLNRIDEIIVFHQLTKADMKKILQILLKDLERRCKEQMDIELKVRDTVKEYLVENSFDSKYGARPLKRAIQSKIEDPLAEAILNGEVKKGDTVAAGMNKKEITFKVLEKK